MVGTSLTRTRGGISTLAADILNCQFPGNLTIEYIESQGEDLAKPRKLFLAINAVFRFLFKCALMSPAAAHIHVGSNASLYRETFFVWIARLFQVPVVAHFHAGDFNEYFEKQPRVGRWIIVRGLEKATRILAVSNRTAIMLKGVVKHPDIYVLPNCLDIAPLLNLPRNSRAERLNILFVGAVGKLKGERDLLKAASKLKADGYDFTLSIIGYNAQSVWPIVERLDLVNNILELGPVPAIERVRIFERADIFVLPTYAEAMPASVIEAMAAELPIVTTNVGGIPELMSEHESGILVAPGDIDALAEAVRMVLSDEPLRKRLGSNARRSISSRAGIGQYIEELSEHLLKVIRD